MGRGGGGGRSRNFSIGNFIRLPCEISISSRFYSLIFELTRHLTIKNKIQRERKKKQNKIIKIMANKKNKKKKTLSTLMALVCNDSKTERSLLQGKNRFINPMVPIYILNAIPFCNISQFPLGPLFRARTFFFFLFF